VVESAAWRKTVPNPDDETALIILTILELLDKRETPERVRDVYRMWQEVLRQRPIK
jgi:hypothetical protein